MAKTYRVNDPSISVSGTSLQGVVYIPYQTLVEILGEPLEGTDKTQAEWHLQWKGRVATIYDYRDSRPVEEIGDWHIGGHDKLCLVVVQKALPDFTVEGR